MQKDESWQKQKLLNRDQRRKRLNLGQGRRVSILVKVKGGESWLKHKRLNLGQGRIVSIVVKVKSLNRGQVEEVASWSK
jgi:hypothetical protein